MAKTLFVPVKQLMKIQKLENDTINEKYIVKTAIKFVHIFKNNEPAYSNNNFSKKLRNF